MIPVEFIRETDYYDGPLAFVARDADGGLYYAIVFDRDENFIAWPMTLAELIDLLVLDDKEHLQKLARSRQHWYEGQLGHKTITLTPCAPRLDLFDTP